METRVALIGIIVEQDDCKAMSFLLRKNIDILTNTTY